mmetsp:Transcript_6328/g.12540  ORF Transcript_6328/g.12540 Transcript_6328/m.12540 type:complete len:106 (-) Transcript_6328:513-830(-)
MLLGALHRCGPGAGSDFQVTGRTTVALETMSRSRDAVALTKSQWQRTARDRQCKLQLEDHDHGPLMRQGGPGISRCMRMASGGGGNKEEEEEISREKDPVAVICQ